MVIFTDDTFKYEYDLLQSNSNDFKCIKEFFDITTTNTKIKILQIHKVSETNAPKSLNKKRKNLMLFHGTNGQGVEGILKKGFKNSQDGKFGKGVYMTECPNVALSYSRGMPKNQSNKIRFIFVNEVLQSETLKTLSRKNFSDKNAKHKPPFEKYINFEGSQQLTEADYKEDAHGRRYRNVPHTLNSHLDEYVADESITVPRYLIEVEDMNTEKIIGFLNLLGMNSLNTKSIVILD